MWGDLRTIKSLVFPARRDLADSLLPQINLVINILKWARLCTLLQIAHTFDAIKMSDDGLHPRFMGLTGRPLSTAVSVVATTGFLLFGYDRE